MSVTTFKDLRIGDEFQFAEPGSDFHAMMGPWRKVSPRKYVLRIGNEPGRIEHQVGTIHVEVVAVVRDGRLVSAVPTEER